MGSGGRFGCESAEVTSNDFIESGYGLKPPLAVDVVLVAHRSAKAKELDRPTHSAPLAYTKVHRSRSEQFDISARKFGPPSRFADSLQVLGMNGRYDGTRTLATPAEAIFRADLALHLSRFRRHCACRLSLPLEDLR